MAKENQPSPVCYECGAEMYAKPDTPFWICPNCNLDTEVDFDEAVRRGLELGIDIVGIMADEEKEEED